MFKRFPINGLYFLILLSLVIVPLLVYQKGLSGSFLLDDENNIQPIEQLNGKISWNSLKRLSKSNQSGITGRPISALSFAIDDQYWPANPYSFKRTNLLLHCITALLVFYWLYILSASINKKQSLMGVFVIGFISLYWAIHPLNISTVLYVVQRMVILSSLFTLCALIFYLKLRRRDLSQKKFLSLLFAFGISSLLSLFSKEIGALIPIFICSMELTILKENKPNLFAQNLIKFAFLPYTFLLIVGIIVYYGLLHPSLYHRDFTNLERLFTESRILVQYLYQILWPPIQGTGLVHDDIVVSQNLLTPLSTVLSSVFWVGIFIVAVKYRNKIPVFSFAVFWFLGGHLLESTIIPLELYYEHRNYLPMLGPFYALVSGLLIKLPKSTNKISSWLPSIMILLFVWSVFASYQTTRLWGDTRLLFTSWYIDHPQSSRAATSMAYIQYKYKNHQGASQTIKKSTAIHPKNSMLNWIALLNECSSGSSSANTLNELLAQAKHANFEMYIPNMIKEYMILLETNTCIDIDYNDLLTIIDSYMQSDLYSANDIMMSNFYGIRSTVYLKQRNIALALVNLDYAYKYRAAYQYLFKKIYLLITINQIDEARKVVHQIKKHHPDILQVQQGVEFFNRIKPILNVNKTSTTP